MVKVRAARGAAALLVVSLVVLAGCGGGGDGRGSASRPAGFAASRAYVAQAVTASRRAPHRFEARLSLGLPGPADDAPVTTGYSDGRWTYTRSDARHSVEASGEKLPFDPDKISWVTETVTDGHTFFLKVPFVDDVAAARPAAEVPPVVGVLRGLGNGWGHVDLTALGDPVPVAVGKWLPGTRDLGVRQALDVAVRARSVTDRGAVTVGGETMQRLTAEVDFDDLLNAEGIDVSSALASPNTPPGFAQLVHNAQLKVQLWIDRQGHVRRLKVDTGDSFEQIAKAAGNDVQVPDEFKIEGDFRFFDYGDKKIDVTQPRHTVDITKPLQALSLG